MECDRTSRIMATICAQSSGVNNCVNRPVNCCVSAAVNKPAAVPYDWRTERGYWPKVKQTRHDRSDGMVWAMIAGSSGGICRMRLSDRLILVRSFHPVHPFIPSVIGDLTCRSRSTGSQQIARDRTSRMVASGCGISAGVNKGINEVVNGPVKAMVNIRHQRRQKTERHPYRGQRQGQKTGQRSSQQQSQ